MHINSHFALGVIVASIFHQFFNFTFIDYTLVIIFSFICDFDVFFSKYAKDHNHRMLISHSVIPSLVVIILGLTFNWTTLIIGGIEYFIHVVVDTFDWGTNFFYFNKKQFGLKFLISKEELENLPAYISKYKKTESFFDNKYYSSKISITIEISLFFLMVVFNFIFTFQFILLSLFYFIGLYFHLSRHFYLKRAEAET
jgi:hypothetical protein